MLQCLWILGYSVLLASTWHHLHLTMDRCLFYYLTCLLAPPISLNQMYSLIARSGYELTSHCWPLTVGLRTDVPGTVPAPLMYIMILCFPAIVNTDILGNTVKSWMRVAPHRVCTVESAPTSRPERSTQGSTVPAKMVSQVSYVPVP